MENKYTRIHASIYLIFDILSLALAFVLSMLIRFGVVWDEILIRWYMGALLYITFITAFTMYFNKLYDMKYKSWVSQLPKIFLSFIYTMLSFFTIIFFVRSISFSRLTLFYFSFSALILLIAGRYMASIFIKSLYAKGIGVKKLLVMGVNDRTLDVAGYLSTHPEFGYKVVGYTDYEKFENHGDMPYLGGIEHYDKIVEERRINTILLDIKDTSKIREIVTYCEQKYIQVYMIPTILEVATNPVEIGQISTIPLIKFKEGRISGIQAKTKRIFDIFVSLIGIFLTLPIFLVVSIVIKLTSKGPVFFSHNRLGMNGEIIKVHKFRTMVMNADEVLKKLFKEQPELEEEYKTDFKLKKDPRITTIGKWLRKTSLDELPQLFNILKGEMSVVGPRPIVKDEMDKYGEYGKIILKTPPGVTGMWQISGRNDLSYAERVRLDMYYINNWSFWLDIIIIIKTIPAVLERKGAY